jgi:hypothetical protein
VAVGTVGLEKGFTIGCERFIEGGKNQEKEKKKC